MIIEVIQKKNLSMLSDFQVSVSCEVLLHILQTP